MLKSEWIAWGLAAVLVLVLPGCGGNKYDTADSRTRAPSQEEMDEVFFTEVGAKLAGAVAANLKAELSRVLAQKSHAEALEVCHAEAIPITEEIASSAEVRADIKRTSLRYRNPANAPDEQEKEALEYFRAGAAEGSMPSSYLQIVERHGEKFYRYYKPLQASGLCLSCHGTLDHLADGVAGRLNEVYPEDKAIDYNAGGFRGVIRVEMARR